MKWTEHILNGSESLVRSLSLRVWAIKKVSQVASFRNRKLIANGIFMSKLLYLIPLWGGSAKYLIRVLQVLFTPTAELLKQYGWLSVSQLSVYHSVVQVFKVLQARSPKYLHSMFTTPYGYKTREADSGKIRHSRRPELEISKDSFRWRSADFFNSLPAHIRKSDSLKMFKQAAKDWIKENIDLN